MNQGRLVGLLVLFSTGPATPKQARCGRASGPRALRASSRNLSTTVGKSFCSCEG